MHRVAGLGMSMEPTGSENMESFTKTDDDQEMDSILA
jgi:hypothetical protein